MLLRFVISWSRHGTNITNAAAKPGDVLVLTKPLGSGIAATAIKRSRASQELRDEIVGIMIELNRGAAVAMRRIGVKAATDVTGFGLLGHLGEMMRSSEVSATISERHIELDPGNLQDELLETRHQRLGDMVSDLTYEKRETHVLAGKPAEVIPTLAASLDVNITTVGTHSRSGIDKLLLGNTAEKVLAKIPGDVLTIRPHYQRESA